ncbi:MAG: 30S ribosomal protein S8 [bacterium]
MVSDPIADMLTRIRNAIHAERELVEIPFSKLKMSLAQILEKEGYVSSASLVKDGNKGKILVTLRYTDKKESVLMNLKRVSKPGRRVYVGYEEIKPVLGGMGLCVISTSKGLMTDKQAKESKVGGEILCTIW